MSPAHRPRTGFDRWLSRRHVVRCSCGWAAQSDTRPGAVMLGEAHLAEHGIAGHVVTVPAADES